MSSFMPEGPMVGLVALDICLGIVAVVGFVFAWRLRREGCHRVSI